MKTTVKYLLILTAIMLLVQNQSFYAQNLKKVFKYIEKAEIDKAELEMKEYTEEIKKSAVDYTIYIIAGTIITSNDKSQSYDPYKSLEMFEEISRIDANKTEVDEFLLNYSYSEDKVQELIFQNIFKDAKKLNTESSYKKALSVCKKCFYEKEVVKLKEIAAYNEAKSQKSILVYKNFISNYPDSEYKKEIQELLEEFAFSQAKTIMTEQAMNEYMIEYSDKENKCLPKSIHLRDSIAYSKLNKTYFEYLAFSKKYPKSEFIFKIQEELPNLLYDQAKKESNLKLYELFITDYPNDNRINYVKEQFESLYYQNLRENLSIVKFNNFIKIFPNSKYNELLAEIYSKILTNNDLKKMKYKGMVKLEKIISNNIYSTTEEMDTTLQSFDENGNWIYCKGSNQYSTYKYDNKGNKIEHFSSNGDNLITYKYDEKGNLSELQSFINNTMNFQELYFYNTNGYLLKKISNDVNRNRQTTDTYKYDNNDKCVEEASDWNNENGVKTFKYNVTGALIEESYKSIKKSNEYVIKYKYDKMGNEIEKIKYSIDGYAMDKDIHRFDESGNLIEEQRNDDHLFTYTYEFDYMGNWIIKNTLKDGKLEQKDVRIFEYY